MSQLFCMIDANVNINVISQIVHDSEETLRSLILTMSDSRGFVSNKNGNFVKRFLNQRRDTTLLRNSLVSVFTMSDNHFW